MAVRRKRLRGLLWTALFLAALMLAAIGSEVNLKTLFTHFGNFVSYFDRIQTLDDHSRVWTNFGEWFWGWQKWLKLLGETILISYVGTLSGAVLAFEIDEASAKMRDGMPNDEPEDKPLPIWSGIIPIETTRRDPVPDELSRDIPLPAHLMPK